jgi:hypothetical protein
MIKSKGTILTVGEGRGFVVEHKYERLIVTAAHCLPHLPPADRAAYDWELCYPKLLGALGQKPSVMAQCLFANPVDDVAVLGSPDNQIMCDDAECYEALLECAVPFSIGQTPAKKKCGYLFSIEGDWFKCQVKSSGSLWVSESAQPIRGGMSGSPVISKTGAAIGIVASAHVTIEKGKLKDIAADEYGSSNPCLACDLPVWLLRSQKKLWRTIHQK